MENHSDNPRHPGTYVRDEVIPFGMSVKEAARQLDIGRPALSNFLNGKASLSPEMAVRLQKAFGADSGKLLEMQAAWERRERRDDDRKVAVSAFVPPFLAIKAREIESWAGRSEARCRLPVLLRRLVHTTGGDLRRVDFPGYGNAQRRGIDGVAVEADSATAWIPEGTSYWEFGTSKKPSAKAEHDYVKRLASVAPAESAKGTFVFVTPRNWPGKTEWEAQKNASSDWKAVRAYDASDLEQWLEESPSAQIWFSEQLGKPTDGYETLQRAWHRWADASEPRLTRDIFAPVIAEHRETFKTWLSKPSARPLVVAAASRDEMLAFLDCMFGEAEFRRQKDRAAIFTCPKVLGKLVTSSIEFIPIVHSETTERALFDAPRRLHCIVFRPNNAADVEADIALDLLGHDAFRDALEKMGVEEDIDRLARKSGRSPTILRRLLSPIEAIKKPEWANDREMAKGLVPITLIGAWNNGLEADREILSRMANLEYEAIEREFKYLRGMDDSPVWCIGPNFGVVSKIDALFAIAETITSVDLDRFFSIAEKCVLSKADQAIGESENSRLAANLPSKERDHSGALRTGVLETLVILSVHDDDLFGQDSGLDVEARVTKLIRELLEPLTIEKLRSHADNLPGYAEAAPDAFLKIVKEDLRSNCPAIFEAFKPTDSFVFGTPAEEALIQALKCLAWLPKYLTPVSKILAELSRNGTDDNWPNRPLNSLQAIFRSREPQTAASVEQRTEALKYLEKNVPHIAWDICIEQINPEPWMSPSGFKPRWRRAACGAAQVVTPREWEEFNRMALGVLVAWQFDERKPDDLVEKLGDLVEIVPRISKEDENRVWDLIDEWSSKLDEVHRDKLRQRIRQFALTRNGPGRDLTDPNRDSARETRAREVCDGLRPNDPVIRHGWLFADYWVRESVDEIEDEDFDHRKREEWIDRRRSKAIEEIWAECGFDGIRELLSASRVAHDVGRCAASCIKDAKRRADFMRRCLDLDGDLGSKADQCLSGFISALDYDSRAQALRAVAEGREDGERVRLITQAPFRASTWRFLDTYDEDIRIGYWKNVAPSWAQHTRHTSDELNKLIDCLLQAERPRAAFRPVGADFRNVETSRLKRLLRELATSDAEPADHFEPEGRNISEALDSLDGRPGVTAAEMAQLELLFIDVLGDGKHGIRNHGIPNLENSIAQSPEKFVRLVVPAYKRSDGGEDPPDWRPESHERRLAGHLLDAMKKIPGTKDDGEIDSVALVAWLAKTRRLFRQWGRVDVGDYCLGQLLAKAPEDENGIWPREAVCEAMEVIATEKLHAGFRDAVRNSRGVSSRKIWEGGEQEREIAARYRTWVERLRYKFPFVGSVLDDIAARYDDDAKLHDRQAKTLKRLHG